MSISPISSPSFEHNKATKHLRKMAELAHLENMSRELKCPICLSLLSSAVSLTCNHVFCNLCIMKSMKSESNCPVCKVPYQRREIRPAPHMDNLVNIYKSMEIDSGLNILVTQTSVPSKKVPESGKNKTQGESNSAKPKTDRASDRKLKNKKKLKKGGSEKKENTNEKTSDSQVSMQPSSFPTKKRVHVPQNNPFETPMRLEKRQGRLIDQAKKGATDGSIPKQQSTFGKTEVALLPFFWLREDDDGDGVSERLTNQQMEIDQVTNSPLQNLPCFSDINDSDNENPTKMSPKVKGCTGTKVVDLFDSEMFEWTQRACSPELFSTPVKDKVSCELDGIPEEYDRGNREELTSEGAENVNSRQGDGKAYKKLLSYRETNNGKSQSIQGRKKSNNQRKRNSGIKRKCTRANTDEVLGEVSLDATTEGLNLGSNFIVKDVAPHHGKKMIQKNKKASSEMITVNRAVEVEDNHTQSNQTGILNQCKTLVSAEMTDLLIDDSLSDGKLKQRTRNHKKKISQNQRDDSESSKNQQIHNGVAGVLKEIQINKNRGNKNADKTGSVLLKKMSNKGATDINRNECVGPQRANKRLKISNGGDADCGLVDGALDGYAQNIAKATETISVHKEGPQIRSSDKTEPTKKILTSSKNSFLNKCGRVPNPICCAFCQSATTSEPAGEMMHYFNGRPVGPDFNGGSNIIHAHKNCTEWAPNVYFEDDSAINLESELARSRRIKCCCCGIKGAALGCYEVSCRKSFHVTCAELVPECRWDTENFVMLCPLHFSCKLPKEIPGPQKKNKKCVRPKRDSKVQQANIRVHDGASACRQWKGLPNKLVICCSGLTVGEKEVVSNFTRMAGVSLMTTFGPSVTHVIASIDENGAWVKACMEAMEPVAEEEYEIIIDSHGISGGPQCGRQRVLNKQPKLLEGLQFYFMGEFTSSYKGYLQDLVVAAGGTVLHRKPIADDKYESPSVSTTYIIYNDTEPNEYNFGKKSLLNHRRKEAAALASQNGAKVAAHSWILDSIAASKLKS